MIKTRMLVLSVSLAVGFLGANTAPPPADPSLVPAASASSSSYVVGNVEPASTNILDVSGSGGFWRKVACVGCAVALVAMPFLVLNPIGVVGCAAACFL